MRGRGRPPMNGRGNGPRGRGNQRGKWT
jgi:hypothetical protein